MKEIITKYLQKTYILDNYRYNTYTLIDIFKKESVPYVNIVFDVLDIFDVDQKLGDGIVKEFISNSKKDLKPVIYKGEKSEFNGSVVNWVKEIGPTLTIEETIQKWNHIGLLQGLEGTLKINVAIAYENCAQAIINENFEGPVTNVETIVFPVIRRAMSLMNSPEYDDWFTPRRIRSSSKPEVNFKTECNKRKKLALENVDVRHIIESLANGNDKIITLINETYYKGLIIDAQAEGTALSSELIAKAIAMRFRIVEMIDIDDDVILLEAPSERNHY